MIRTDIVLLFSLFLFTAAFSSVSTQTPASLDTTDTDAVSSIVYTAGLEGAYRPTAPDVRHARAAALLDVETDTLLFQYNADMPWPPASLTKLMTIYTALTVADEEEILLATPEPVHSEAYASAMPAGSSLMFLGPDQTVSLDDLFRGLIISSGNDAATEVALRISGSVGRFCRLMNETARRLDFTEFYFEDPAGLSAANRITAGAFARFSARLIDRYPMVIDDYTARTEFTYPEVKHYRVGGAGITPIRQENRNSLVGEYRGADGLKTGFIEASGYNIAVTASRNGRRLVAVVLGVEASSHAEGGRLRAEDARRLLDWGFSSYRRVAFQPPELPNVTVWGGQDDVVTTRAEAIPEVVIPTSAIETIERTVTVDSDIWAPVGTDTAIGEVVYTIDGTRIAAASVFPSTTVAEASLVQRGIDRVRWWLTGSEDRSVRR